MTWVTPTFSTTQRIARPFATAEHLVKLAIIDSFNSGVNFVKFCMKIINNILVGHYSSRFFFLNFEMSLAVSWHNNWIQNTDNSVGEIKILHVVFRVRVSWSTAITYRNANCVSNNWGSCFLILHDSSLNTRVDWDISTLWGAGFVLVTAEILFCIEIGQD